MKKLLCSIIIILSLMPVSCLKKNTEAKVVARDAKYFAVVAMSFNDEYWQKVSSGVTMAAIEYDLRTSFDGIDLSSPTAVSEQVALLDKVQLAGASGVLLAAASFDDDNIRSVVEQITNLNIPIVTIETGVLNGTVVSHISTDNLEAGKLAAKEMAALVGKGKVGAIIGSSLSDASNDREFTFAEIMTENENIEYVSAYSCDQSLEKAKAQTAELFLTHPDLKGIFCTDTIATLGAAAYLEENNLQDQCSLIGFNSVQEELELLNRDVIDGLIVQNPYMMGYNGIKALYEYQILAEFVDVIQQSPATYVTKANISNPNIVEILYPLKK